MAEPEPTRIHPETSDRQESGKDRPHGGSLLAQVSNAMVRIYKDHWGKGPTKARTIYTDDVVLTRLEEIFTRAEVTLVAAGREAEVRDMRAAFHTAFESEFVEVIERLTGRRVQAFLSEIHPATNMGVELFVLEPGGDPHDPESELSHIGPGSDGDGR